jgi:hypothetical protein
VARKRFFVTAITALGEQPCHAAFVGSRERAMKDILFSVVMSVVLFFAVSYVHRAKADTCGSANCAHIEELVTLPQGDGCAGANC